MRTIIITALLPFSLLAQFKIGQIRIIPTTDGTAVGQIEFDTTRADGKAVVLKAPNTATASYTLTLPTAAPASNGDCLTGTTAGVLSFAACTGAGGGVWTASGSDVYRSTGSVTVGSATPDAKFGVVASINDGISVTDGTTRGIVFASSAATNSLVVGTTTNHPVLFFANNAEALRLSPGGALLTRGHILTNAPSASDIGDATNFFQTVYAENGDFTAGSVANQYLKARKLEIADIAGSGGFWDHRSQGSFVSNSSYTIRDNGGSRWIVATRAVSGSAQNRTNLFTDLIPSLRATADGDAVNDSTLPASGASGSRWSKTWTLDLDASGTVKLGTTSAVGQVWTASDTSGNGGWATPTVGVPTSRTISTTSPLTGGGDLTANRTLACPTCFLTSGGTINGGINAGITVTDGTATGILFASGVATNSIVAGTTSAHPFVLFGHNGERARLTATGMTVTGTLGVSGITTLSGDLRFGTDNTNAIGETGTRPSVVFSRIDNTRKLEISDTSGGSGFWDLRVNASAITSNWTLRDNAGSRALAYTRLFTSSPSNSFEVFGALLPAQRSTGSGDAVNDATSPSLGATARRWNTVWADSAEITSAVSSPTFIASANFQGAVDNVTDVGQSSLRMANVWTYGLDAVGTIKLKSSSVVGQVWTASDTDGTGGWATPGTSQWTTSGSDIYFNSGWVTIGATTPNAKLSVISSVNDGLSVGDGTARGIMFASSISTNSVVVGTTSSHPLIIFGHNGERARATSTGFDITGAATVSSYLSVGSTDNLAQLYARASDVNGLRIHNSGTPSSGGGAGIQAAIESAPSTGHRLAFYSFGLRTGGVAYNGASITAFATQNWTPGSAQGTELRFETTANGAASRTASVVVTAGALTLAGNLLFSSDNAYTVGTSSAQPSILYGRVVNSPKVEIRDTSLGSGFWDQRVNASGSASDWHLRDNSGSRAIRFGRFSQNVMTVYGTLLPGKRDTVAGDATTDSVFGDLGQSGVRWAKVWGDDGDFLNGVVAFGSIGFILDRSSRTASTSQVNFRVASSDANAGNWKILARPASPATQSEFAITSNGTTVFSMVEGGSGSFASNMTFGGAVTATQVSATSSGFRIGGTTVIDNSRNLTNIVSFNSTVSATELGYLDGVTSSIQTQIDGKLASSGGTVTGSLSPSPSATYNLGSNSARWLGIHGGTIVAYSVLEAKGTVYAPDGNSGISATVTVRNAAGTGSCTLVFSGGLLTGGTC